MNINADNLEEKEGKMIKDRLNEFKMKRINEEKCLAMTDGKKNNI